MAKMNPTVKAQWVAALRSGEYKQAHGDLRKDDGFCCLGVLCELHRIECGGEWGLPVHGPSSYNGSHGTPPDEVIRWAALPDANPDVDIEGLHGLAVHNDRCVESRVQSRSFSEIADAIEAQL